jgi:hypothetical protein
LEPKQKLKKLLSGRSNFGISEVYGTKKSAENHVPADFLYCIPTQQLEKQLIF